MKTIKIILIFLFTTKTSFADNKATIIESINDVFAVRTIDGKLTCAIYNKPYNHPNSSITLVMGSGQNKKVQFLMRMDAIGKESIAVQITYSCYTHELFYTNPLTGASSSIFSEPKNTFGRLMGDKACDLAR